MRRLLAAPAAAAALLLLPGTAAADVQVAASHASSGARDARTDIRASSARVASDRSWAARIVAYWDASREPNSSGSSAPSATVAPASSSTGSGTDVRSL